MYTENDQMLMKEFKKRPKLMKSHAKFEDWKTQRSRDDTFHQIDV